VYVAQFSPDGRQVLTAGADHTAQVWDAATGARLPWTLRHGSKVNWAAFSPDGRRVVTAGDDNTARVWDAATGEPTTPPMVHRASVLRASFSPDGERILTVMEGQAVYLWETATGQPLTPALRHLGKVIQALFSPDNRFLVSLSTVNPRLWQIAGDDRPADDLQRLGQLLGGARIDAAGSLVPLKPEETEAVWAALRAKYPQDQVPSPGEIVRWHRSDAQECTALGYAFGVAWHQARLAEMGVQP
jgi:WD40 repeat protein